nr:neutrophil cytosol factor 2-like isoform X1 [Pocillopora verrucosa]XP_058963023.1 neutrophil cytosol factor 2-like isoform X1 [Pocillopora verrucosa]
MKEMSTVEILKIWKDGVTFMEKGNYEEALKNFMALEGRTDSSQQLITSGRNLFNIGQMYLALGRMEMAAQAFEESIAKDPMMAIAHYTLGSVNLALDRNERALRNFSDAALFLRGNKLIKYDQLGLKVNLYLCEVLANRAVAQSRLKNAEEAKNDFLMALQFKMEPRQSVIQDLLLCWQSGKSVEPLKMPSPSVFKPSKGATDAINKEHKFMEKSKVVAEVQVRSFPGPRTTPARPQPTRSPPRSPNLSKAVADESLSEQHLPQAAYVKSTRDALLNDLRKNETVASGKEPPNKPLPVVPDFVDSPQQSPRASPTPRFPRTDSGYLSPRSSTKSSKSGSRPVTPPENSRPRTPVEMGPPSKPLPPTPRSKSLSPIPSQVPAEPRKTRDVELVFTQSIKVDESVSTVELLKEAAAAFKLPENSFALWCMKDNQLTVLQDQDLEEILRSSSNNSPQVFCYENKPE